MGQLNGVFNVSAGQCFVNILADIVCEYYGNNPQDLARVLIILPTRRSVRALHQSFMRRAKGDAMLLPKMWPVGDIDDDDSILELPYTDDVVQLVPAIDPLRRILLLSEMIRRVAKQEITSAQAVLSARELARFLDQLQTEGIEVGSFDGLVPEEYSEHWQKALHLLKVIQEPWKSILNAERVLDPMDRRNQMLRLRIDQWRQNPPNYPIIAAGSTGSIPVTRELFACVAQLPQGVVVLPGLDQSLDEYSWTCVGPMHPQYNLKQLLGDLNLGRDDVVNLPGSEPFSERARLISETMRPTETATCWHNLPKFSPGVMKGLQRFDCVDPSEEALTIAVLLRESLEEADQTAALITPDRELARRVAIELRRWDISIDDSTGVPLSSTLPGSFLLLTADMVCGGWMPVALLSALKHPYSRGGLNKSDFGEMVRKLDRMVLRGPNAPSGFDGLQTAVKIAANCVPEMINFFAKMEVKARPLENAVLTEKVPISEIVKAHMDFVEWLASDTDGDCCIWDGEFGEAVCDFILQLYETCQGLRGIKPIDYPELLLTLMKWRPVNSENHKDSRLNIWDPIEARLQQSDLLILGGLNENVWPMDTNVDYWLSRSMRLSLGLSPPERRIGLAAHDFSQLASNSKVVLTRSMISDGAPTVPSRWLLRLEKRLEAAGLCFDAERHNSVVSWSRSLDESTSYTPASPPRFCPPVHSRPRALSLTDIELWMRDPYQIYARHILNLKRLEPISQNPSTADRGRLVHKALEEFLKNNLGNMLQEDSYEELLECGRKAFATLDDSPSVRAFWWLRFVRIADWFLNIEKSRRPGVNPFALERKGSIEITRGLSKPFRISAKADRIDLLENGNISIIDYKTGRLPTTKDVYEGVTLQLPLEAIIAAAGGFHEIPPSNVSSLEYWHLVGTRRPGIIRLFKENPAHLMEQSLKRLERWIVAFDDERTPYLSRPNPEIAPLKSDYDQLARVKEWAVGSLANE